MNKYKIRVPKSEYRNPRRYGQGWFLEPVRHGLSAKGISTGRKLATAGLELSKINYARQLSSGEFRIDDNTIIVCRSESTSYGFRHIADLYRNGSLVDSAKATYYNRTWESYEFESVINRLVDNMNVSDEEKMKIKSNLSDKALGKVESQFKSVAMVASLGNIFGQSPKEKNDWKLRMIKAGLGDKGFEVPEDWDTLSEDEKGKRLDKIIEFMNEKKIDTAKKSLRYVAPKEFFIHRFKRDLEHPAERSYYSEWQQRFASGHPETYMDNESKAIYEKLQKKSLPLPKGWIGKGGITVKIVKVK
jgi:hypothetical protein